MAPKMVSPDVFAAAQLRWRRLRALQPMVEGPIDPILRLTDPAFTETFWQYDGSRIGPEIPGSLHHKQEEAIRHPARHRWLFWGNQVGKTTTGAIDVVMSCLGRHPLQLVGLEPMPPYTAWASALSWELWEKILLPELLTWIPGGRIIRAPEPHVHSTNRDIVIRADNGTESRITGKAAEQGAAKYQSARVNKVWLDEEHPEAIWDEMQPRLLRYHGRTIGTMTPILGMTYVHGRFYEPVKVGLIPTERHWFSHAGLKDNPAITAEALAELEHELANNPSQLAARRDGFFVKPMGLVLPFDMETMGATLAGEAIPALLKRSKCYGSLDLGKWRFAFSWGAVEKSGHDEGTLTLIDEVFSQNEDVDVRAKKVHDQLQSYGVTDIDIWGDCADPDGLAKLNQALELLDSPYRVMPVPGEQKRIAAGILRLESLMNRGAFKVRRGMGNDALWFEGKNAGSNGRPVRGSRWVWEATHWQYPKAADGKVQKDAPDDATADGADMMDGTRYLVMQWLGPPDAEAPASGVGLTMRQRELRELQDYDEPDMTGSAGAWDGVLRQ